MTSAMVVTVVTFLLLTNGSHKTTLLMKLVLLTKLMDTITELDVPHKLNVRTVYQVKVVGLKITLRFIQLKNMVKLMVKKI